MSKAATAVTQLTDRATAVTINALKGVVTGEPDSLAAGVIATHTVTNDRVALGDVIIVNKVSGDVDTQIWVNAVAAGSFTVSLLNTHGSGADTTLLVYHFIVLKGSPN